MILWFFQVKYRNEKKWSAILFCGILFLFTLTAIASIFFVLSSYNTIETEVKIKTVEKGNKFLSKKVQHKKMRYIFISDSFHKPNETTAEESIKEGSCKGKSCIKVTRYKYSSI